MSPTKRILPRPDLKHLTAPYQFIHYSLHAHAYINKNVIIHLFRLFYTFFDCIRDPSTPYLTTCTMLEDDLGLSDYLIIP